MKRSIRLVGFTASDTEQSHKFAIWGGFAASLLGCALAVVGSINSKTASNLMTTAQMSQMASSEMINSASQTLRGLPTDFGGRIRQIQVLNTLASDSGLLISLPGSQIQNEIQQHKASWTSLVVQLGPFERPIELSSQVHRQLVAGTGTLAKISSRIEPYKSSGPGASAFESLSRLQGYVESGFGIEAAHRIGYDIANLGYQLRTNEGFFGSGARDARSAAESLYQALNPIISQWKASLPPEAESARVVESAKAANLAASTLFVSATAAKSGSTLYGLAGLVLIIGGAISSIFGISLAVAEFGARFRKSLSQFDRGEGAMVQLAADAASIADGKLTLEPSMESETTLPVAESLSRIARKFRNQVQRSREYAESMDKQSETLLAQSNSSASSLSHLSSDLTEAGVAAQTSESQLGWMARDASSTSAAAEIVTNALTASSRAIQDAVDRMDTIRSAVQETSKRIKRLGEGSQSLASVLTEGASLSEQINVIAMNAALEAERIGSTGGGFKVISAEIKGTASKLERLLSHANEAIEMMQADARVASEAMEKSSQKVASGAFIGEVAAAAMSSAKFGVDTISQSCAVIESSSVDEQAAMSALSDQMISMQTEVSQIITFTQHISKIASEMNAVAANGLNSFTAQGA